MTPEEALAHPTWNMGPKITVDSATLANKGLELIEAHFLFGLDYERIEVVVHPTSIVHALVRFRDGAALAHLGYPDMRVPISFALTYPERAATPVPAARPRVRADARVRGARPGDVPAARARPRGRRARRHLPVRLQRRERGRRRRVPRRPAAVPRDRRDRRGDARAPSTARPRRDLGRRCVDGGRGARAPRWRSADGCAGMTCPRSRSSGSRFLILIHEARPLLHRPRGRDEAAAVLHRLPAGARQDEAEGDRVRHRRDPARRLREDPGDAPAGAADVDVDFGPALLDEPRRCRAGRAREAAARGRRLRRARERARPTSTQALARSRAPPAAARAARAGLDGARATALGADAYWRAADLEARRRDRGGPGDEPPLRDRPPRGRLHARRSRAAPRGASRRCSPNTPGGEGRPAAGRRDRRR